MALPPKKPVLKIQAKSPVINDSSDFVPLAPVQAQVDPALIPPEEPPPPAATQNVPAGPAPGKGGFIPVTTPGGGGFMPTPDRVIHLHDEKRLDTVPFEFADIRALAQRILKRAQEQGQAKIDAARKQVAAMEKTAYDKAYKEAFPKGEKDGFAKGEKDGAAKAEAKVQAAIKAEKETIQKNVQPVAGVMQQAVAAMEEAKELLRRTAEGDLLLLAIDLARRLVGHELSVDPEAIKPLAAECIDLITDRSDITVRVNPADHQVMLDYYPDLKLLFPDLGPIKVLPDPAVERGGIMAATREAEVDMRLATRLATFEEVILGYSGEQAIPPWNRINPELALAAGDGGAYPPSGMGYPEGDRFAAVPQGADPIAVEMPAADSGYAVSGEADAAAAAAGAEGLEGGEAALSDADLADLAELADMPPPAG